MKLPWVVKLACMLCCTLLSFSGCGMSVQKEDGKSTVQVKIGNVSGNGIIWELTNNTCVVATAGHILSMGEGEIEVTFSNGESMGVVDYWTTDIDLAFLVVEADFTVDRQNDYESVEVNLEKSGQLQSDAGVKIKTIEENVEEVTYTGKVLNPWIYVEDFGQYMLMLRTEVTPGMSGAGVYDEENYFLGIICGGNDNGEAVVTPASVVSAWYQDCKR